MSDIILETGFQTIYSEVQYNNDKLLNLFKSGHVINIKEMKFFNRPNFIFGYVIRQISVTSTPYKVKIKVSMFN